jgi:hypothetical protein
MVSRPYSKLIEILRYTLEQVEKDVRLNRDDAGLDELKRSLQLRLDDLERRTADLELDE